MAGAGAVADLPEASPVKGGSASKARPASAVIANKEAAVAGIVMERNNYHFYMTVCVFVQLYRTCLNETIYETFEGRTSLLAAESNYTQTRSPDCLPMICNEFNTEYLPLKCNIFDKNVAVGLTQHLVMWLYHRKFTKTRIQPIRS